MSHENHEKILKQMISRETKFIDKILATPLKQKEREIIWTYIKWIYSYLEVIDIANLEKQREMLEQLKPEHDRLMKDFEDKEKWFEDISLPHRSKGLKE